MKHVTRKRGRPADPFDLENYTYELPEKQIAQYPIDRRSVSRLLALNRADDSLLHGTFGDIPELLPENSVVVINTSTVFPARLLGRKAESSGRVEFLLLTPLPLIRGEKDRGEWWWSRVEGLIKPAKKVKVGQQIWFCDRLGLSVDRKDLFGRVSGRLLWKNELLPIIEEVGLIPLPPYIKRESEARDWERYQTVYADKQQAGSMAAATAGLHFDQEVLDKLLEKGIDIVPLNLYVGYGTFNPVRCADIREHELHAEYVRIDASSARKINEAKKRGRPVVAVGTTTVRTLEGVREKLGRIAEYMGWVDVYIYPGFRFKVVDHLITNFHLPRSSLLLMIAAFAGRERILKAYESAVEEGYRFFSYGDAMLII
ncbi:MAG: tRNA preQ1(34) S-adenosylmethionine ribosyltransferase-isomerase QueA [Desulfohalobiaceae bacterium]|nr:tRNA preQ1(34) S-adenosylmethionine ribosyltransferase-isomerase QueA [Desulfohalobiaceae bacterium]